MHKKFSINEVRTLSSTILIVLLLCCPIAVSDREYELSETEESIEIELDYINYQDLFKRIAHIESRHNYNVANKSKTVGKYQAGKASLLEFGYTEEQVQAIYDSFDTVYTSKGHPRYHFDINTFPPEDQERFIRWYMHKMEKVYLKEAIEKYVGTTINNVYITRAGILNASMLGFNNVIKFLESNGEINYTPKKGYSVQNRLAQFERTEIIS
ncbi:MAG: hypothetical protein MJ198_01250 [Bacteroidales bacterium]|nr:hypothetical protein [Bacteroidales bacterium]